MKIVIYLCILLFTIQISAQEIRELQPKIQPLDFSIEGEKEFEKQQQHLAEVIDLLKRGVELDSLPELDQNVFNENIGENDSYWDITNAACSWYCGGGPQEVSASSSLKSQGNTNYLSEYAHDLNYKTAWVEGVKGYGVGEYLLYTFDAYAPRITNIIVVNGYVKSEKAWRENSRVKKLKMYIDDQPYAILNLKDERAANHFTVKPIGIEDRSNLEPYYDKTYTIKFEILEVYPGDKYEDTVISEIYFDGIDVHCFAVGTLITMADRSEKPIEEIKVGEKIISYDFDSASYFETEVTELADVIHNNLIKITWSDDSSVTCTQDHPFLNTEGQWMSFDPKKTKKDYMYDTVLELGTGSTMKTLNGLLSVRNIEILRSSQWTYTIVGLEKGNVFFANNVAVGTEPLRLKKKGKILEAIQK